MILLVRWAALGFAYSSHTLSTPFRFKSRRAENSSLLTLLSNSLLNFEIYIYVSVFFFFKLRWCVLRWMPWNNDVPPLIINTAMECGCESTYNPSTGAKHVFLLVECVNRYHPLHGIMYLLQYSPKSQRSGGQMTQGTKRHAGTRKKGGGG